MICHDGSAVWLDMLMLVFTGHFQHGCDLNTYGFETVHASMNLVNQLFLQIKELHLVCSPLAMLVES